MGRGGDTTRSNDPEGKRKTTLFTKIDKKMCDKVERSFNAIFKNYPSP